MARLSLQLIQTERLSHHEVQTRFSASPTSSSMANNTRVDQVVPPGPLLLSGAGGPEADQPVPETWCTDFHRLKDI